MLFNFGFHDSRIAAGTDSTYNYAAAKRGNGSTTVTMRLWEHALGQNLKQIVLKRSKWKLVCMGYIPSFSMDPALQNRLCMCMKTKREDVWCDDRHVLGSSWQKTHRRN